VSEIDVAGQVLSTFTHDHGLYHLSTDCEDRVLVADGSSYRILLLNSKLRLERVLLDTNSQVKLWLPHRLSYS